MDYPITPVLFTGVRFNDQFWLPRLKINREVSIPFNFAKSEETGRIDNFTKAAGLMEGPHEGIFYDDSDVFKVIEGAAYSLHLHPDKELSTYLDELIKKISGAQEEDGYLYTARTIDTEAVTPEKEGNTRWSNLAINHELYNVGHMYEAAVAHYQATGKRTLLDVAIKNAELINDTFGPGKINDVPGHQEIEIGLVKLYRETQEKHYLDLAKFFLDQRGYLDHPDRPPSYSDDPRVHQDHLPVIDQREVVGHCVRAGYMYSAMTDIAALTGDQDYVEALDALWTNAVEGRTYLTGGIGSRHKWEAFGEDFELPNSEAYAETCAAIANMMWNHRMFLLHGDAKYIDLLERTLYNGFLSGVSMQGDAFFYVNPLSSDGKWAFNNGISAERSPWFETSCCPTNVTRVMPSLPGYVYAYSGTDIYVNLFVAGTATIPTSTGNVMINQETDYPWSGDITLTIDIERELDFTLHLRIPGWTRNQPFPSNLYRYLNKSDQETSVWINGNPVKTTINQGFAVLERTWLPGDKIHLRLPMEAKRIVSHVNVEENRGLTAIERGPIVYCAEGVDNNGKALNISLPDNADLEAEYNPNLLGGVTKICWNDVTLIPYYAWSHRGLGEMNVWLKRS